MARLTERSRRFYDDSDLHQHRDKLHQDDFSGAEIDRELSLLQGLKRPPIAKLRARPLTHAASMRAVGGNVGAAPGDALLAGFLAAGGNGPEALAEGVTWAAAACVLPGTAMPGPADLHRNQVRVQPVEPDRPLKGGALPQGDHDA